MAVTISKNAASGLGGQGGGIHSRPGGTVLVNGGTLIDSNTAYQGAGISSFMGTVSLNDADVTNNTAQIDGGGIFSIEDTLNITNGSTVNSNTATMRFGGGIVTQDGTATLDGGTLISGNSAAAAGGGIFNAGGTSKLTIDGIMVTANTAGDGGGVYNSGGTLIVQNGSNISLNLANGTSPSGRGGGIYSSGGTATITGSTVSTNSATLAGGGIHTSAIMSIDGTTISGNTASGDMNFEGGGGIYNSFGGQLNIGQTSTVNIMNNVANGDLGSGGGIFNDNTAKLTVNQSTISGNTAIRAGGGIEDRLSGGLTLTNVTLDKNIAQGNTLVTGSPGNGGGLHLSFGTTVTIDGGTITNNSAAQEGGGLWIAQSSTLNVINTSGAVLIDGNTASGTSADQGGGGIFNAGGTIDIDGSKGMNSIAISNNIANGTFGSGGGILNDAGGTLTISFADIAGNTANRAGGGIEDNSGAGLGVTLTQVNLIINVAQGGGMSGSPGNGGGLHVTGAGDVTISGSNVLNNSAALEGGGLWNGSGTMTIDGTDVSSNTASGDAADDGGGGIFNNGGTLNLGATTPVNVNTNQASGTAGSGGGIFNNGGSVVIGKNSAVNANASNGPGAGIFSTGGSGTTLKLTNAAVSFNTTIDDGGGIAFDGPGTLSITGGTFSTNAAFGNGGGIALLNGNLNASGVTLTGFQGQQIYASNAVSVFLDAVTASGTDLGLETHDTSSVVISGGTYSGVLAQTTGSVNTTGTVTFTNDVSLQTTGAVNILSGGWAGIPNVTLSPGTVATFGIGTTSTYTGTTTLTSGTTLVNGTLDNSGGTVTVQSGATLGGTGTIDRTIVAEAGSTVAPGLSPGVLHTGAVTFSSGATFAVELNGTTVGTNYDQLNVTGAVDLGSATLSVSTGFLPTKGNTFTIINNDGADAVTGTFNGLDEGDLLVISGTQFAISYVGGDGNDVVLTATGNSPTDIALSNNKIPENAGANAVIGTLSATDPDAMETFTFSLPMGVDDNAQFNINGTQLRTNSSFDFETKSSYTITVRVTDSENLTYDEQFTITVTDVQFTLTLTTNVNSRVEGGTITGTLTRTGSTLLDQTVTLNSSDTTEATVPTTVIIPAGKASVTFTIQAVDDTFADGAQPATITASTTDAKNSQITVTITDNDVSVAGDDILFFDDTSRRFKLGTNKGNTFTWFQSNALPAPSKGYDSFVGDFDGDGDLDGAVRNRDTNIVNVLLNNGDGTLTGPQSRGTAGTSGTAGFFQVGDYDGDGADEILWLYLDGTNSGSVFIKRLTPGGATFFMVTANPDYDAFITGDFNGDGFDDLVGLFDNQTMTATNIIPFFSIASNNPSLPRRLRPLSNNPVLGTFGKTVVGDGLTNFLATDLNGDGKDDLVAVTVGGSTPGQILHSTTTGNAEGDGVVFVGVQRFVSSSRGPIYFPTTFPAPVLVGHFSDDLLSDVLAVDHNGLFQVGVASLNPTLLNPVVLSNPSLNFGSGVTSGQYLVGDFNGDGYDDLVSLGVNATVYLSDGYKFSVDLDFGPIIGGGAGTIGVIKTG